MNLLRILERYSTVLNVQQFTILTGISPLGIQYEMRDVMLGDGLTAEAVALKNSCNEKEEPLQDKTLTMPDCWGLRLELFDLMSVCYDRSKHIGDLAQMVEHSLSMRGAQGSIPWFSTHLFAGSDFFFHWCSVISPIFKYTAIILASDIHESAN
ncbi:hypothetical protein PROFUN_08359 [Planoprotostelium fungivorum]|uniref:Uncharacterized protein n=1 Tax=Planoprotostelium fungivorum TaxID=1890364 RepID=A0A2P6NI44_9EUKA|nr:hypothetical protein PROFUN_08359 [Planoprotostelium fungivorum]